MHLTRDAFEPAALSSVNVVLVQGAPGSNVAVLPASRNFTLELHAWLRQDANRSSHVLSFESPFIYSVTPSAGVPNGMPLPNLLKFSTAADNSSFIIDFWVISRCASPSVAWHSGTCCCP